MLFNDILSTEDTIPQDYALEEMTFNLPEFTNYFTGFISKFTAVIDSNRLIPYKLFLSDQTYVAKALQCQSKYVLDNITVVVPEFVIGEIQPYLKTLNVSLLWLMTMEDRLIKPLEFWANHMLTVPNYADKVWVNIPGADKALDEHKAALAVFFKDTVGDGECTKTFSSVYGSVDTFKLSGKLLEDLVVKIEKVLDGKLLHRVNNLSNLIGRLYSEDKVANSLKTISYAKIKPIVDLVIQNARELEMISVIAFNVKTASHAHNATLVKLKNNLK